MANSLSAKKRIRQNAKQNAHNRWRKRQYRALIKDYQELLLHGTIEQCEAQLRAIYKKLDQVADQEVIHKNTASRYKSRLTARLNAKKRDAEASAA